jgi:bifunctional non-homologous end joining protein LigD
VLALNNKRSVQMGVLRAPGGMPVPIGNVTIPANHEIPRVGDIIDVRYLYANRGGCLYQPQYRGRRDDVSREECLETRIKYKGGMEE